MNVTRPLATDEANYYYFLTTTRAGLHHFRQGGGPVVSPGDISEDNPDSGTMKFISVLKLLDFRTLCCLYYLQEIRIHQIPRFCSTKKAGLNRKTITSDNARLGTVQLTHHVHHCS